MIEKHLGKGLGLEKAEGIDEERAGATIKFWRKQHLSKEKEKKKITAAPKEINNNRTTLFKGCQSKDKILEKI